MHRRHFDPHIMTETQIRIAMRELEEEITHLRELVHDFGPSSEREADIHARREQLLAFERELEHRRNDAQ